MDLPEITEVKRLALRPGDRVVLRFEDVLNEQQVDEVRDAMRRAFGDLDPKPPVIVLDGGADIEVIGPEADGEGAGPAKVSLDFSGDTEMLARILREYIRRRGGGSVQRALGGA